MAKGNEEQRREEAVRHGENQAARYAAAIARGAKRVCPRCKIEKLVADFYVGRAGYLQLGCSTYCKECTKLKDRSNRAGLPNNENTIPENWKQTLVRIAIKATQSQEEYNKLKAVVAELEQLVEVARKDVVAFEQKMLAWAKEQ